MNVSEPAVPEVLLLDDDSSLHRAIEIRLRGFARVESCHSGNEALERIRERRFDAALVDINLGPGPSGLEWVQSLRQADPDLAMIAFTAHGEYGTALDSFKAHCFDFIPKTLRQDGEFKTKLAQAVEHTRAQRGRSRNTAEVGALRTALAEIVVNNELQLSSADIQRGLLAETLDSLSGLVGSIELIELRLSDLARRSSEMRPLVRQTGETTAELHDMIERLRDYFAEPECAVRSINEILAQAVRLVQDEDSHGERLVRDELTPDAQFAGDGRALFRALVILLRLMLKGMKGAGVVMLKPSLLLNAAREIQAFRTRPGARILHTPNFRADSRVGVAIDLIGSNVAVEPEVIAQLFSPAAPLKAGPSAWSAVAMLARAEALLGVEWNPGMGVRYRVVVKV